MDNEAHVLKAFRDRQEPHSLSLERGPHSLGTALQPATLRAQDFLWSAQLAVENAVNAAFLLRNLSRTADGKSTAGNMGDSEQDLLRAALVFAGAGLDASLKRLIRDCLSELSRRDELVRAELHKFAERYISGADVSVEPSTLMKLLLADEASPREVLVGAWRDRITDGSLQSADKVGEVCTALGVTDATLRKRIGSKSSLLDEAFKARNKIVHELDLRDRFTAVTDLEGVQRKKTRRGATKTLEWCTEILSVSQIVIDHVGSKLFTLPAA